MWRAATSFFGGLWAWLVLALGAVAIAPCIIAIGLWHCVFPARLCRFTRIFNWSFGRVTLALLAPAIPVRLANRDVAVREPGSIIVCNHQSALDSYLLAAQNQKDLCLVAKHWPFKLFFFAPAMRHAGFVDAEGSPPEEVERLCCERLKQGATLVMFPEGRRSRTGELGRFHSGVFRIAIASCRPVLPLVIRDSFRAFPPGAKWFRLGAIHMDFLEPVRPEDFAHEALPHRAMMRHVRQLYVECLKNPVRREL